MNERNNEQHARREPSLNAGVDAHAASGASQQDAAPGSAQYSASQPDAAPDEPVTTGTNFVLVMDDEEPQPATPAGPADAPPAATGTAGEKFARVALMTGGALLAMVIGAAGAMWLMDQQKEDLAADERADILMDAGAAGQAATAPAEPAAADATDFLEAKPDTRPPIVTVAGDAGVVAAAAAAAAAANGQPAPAAVGAPPAVPAPAPAPKPVIADARPVVEPKPAPKPVIAETRPVAEPKPAPKPVVKTAAKKPVEKAPMVRNVVPKPPLKNIAAEKARLEKARLAARAKAAEKARLAALKAAEPAKAPPKVPLKPVAPVGAAEDVRELPPPRVEGRDLPPPRGETVREDSAQPVRKRCPPGSLARECLD